MQMFSQILDFLVRDPPPQNTCYPILSGYISSCKSVTDALRLFIGTFLEKASKKKKLEFSILGLTPGSQATPGG